ncbi:MAG TPA: hypothetical protein VFK44_00145 [Bacillales bacterium]|nr:hypothetical protein [Bacillales bacterium]
MSDDKTNPQRVEDRRFGSKIDRVRSSRAPSKDSGIKQVDLDRYRFHPPGPMGWTAKEYEKMIHRLQKEREKDNGTSS